MDPGSRLIFRGGTQSDPTISPVTTAIMITTSNSLFAEEWDAQSHVQQKAEVFSGSKPTRVKVRSPVARIACAEETKRMESIDKAIPGMVSKSSGESAGRPALRSE